MQTYASLTQGELFPFAPFKMYSYGYSGENLTMIRIFCQDFRQEERLLSNYRLVKVESYYATDIEDILTKHQQLNEEALAEIKKISAPLVRETEDRCQKLRVYKLGWEHFDGRLRDKPVTKEWILDL